MRGLRRPSPALVVACLALMVALSGTSYANVMNVPLRSVGTPQLKNGAVTAVKLRNGAVPTVKLANGAVTTAKLRNNAVTLAKLAPNARIPGPQGPAGPPGPQGPPGDAGALPDGSITTAKLAANAVMGQKLSTSIASANVVIATGSTGSAGATCANGGKATGGGASWVGGVNAAQAQQLHIVQSYPSPPSSWGARGYNNTGANRTLIVWAACVTGTP